MNIPFIILISILFVVSLVLFRHQETLNQFLHDIQNPYFDTFLIIVMSIVIWGINNDNQRIRRATEAGLVSLMIAYSSRLKLIFPVFFMIVLFTYFSFVENPY